MTRRPYIALYYGYSLSVDTICKAKNLGLYITTAVDGCTRGIMWCVFL